MRNEFWRKPRQIERRIIVEGDLILQSAAHFGAGQVDPFSKVDMTLLYDLLEGKALLPGASIAGALRNYLRERNLGYHAENSRDDRVTVALFGMENRLDTTDDDRQSQLIVYDSLASVETGFELRDGVKIDPATRTAEKGKKYDLEVLAAGTTFPLKFELVIEKQQKNGPDLKQALATALQGFEQGEIQLGARKNRGLGQVKVNRWQVWEYDLTQTQDLLQWLTAEQVDIASPATPKTGQEIAALLEVEEKTIIDRRHYFQMEVDFALDGALLVRSAFSYGSNAADTVQLHARQEDGSIKPIIPGSSLAGVIRHRALRIANTLGIENSTEFVDKMFGYHREQDQNTGNSVKSAQVSRVRVHDAVVEETISLVQNRIRIDRFTGGAHETALFSEQPVFGKNDSQLTLDLTLINPDEAEIGLLLQVLKDLWTGDLTVGGSSSVGRGCLRGTEARLVKKEAGHKANWIIKQPVKTGPLEITGDKMELEAFAGALAAKGGKQ